MKLMKLMHQASARQPQLMDGSQQGCPFLCITGVAIQGVADVLTEEAGLASCGCEGP